MTPVEILTSKLRLMDLQTFGTVKVAERQIEALAATGYAVVPVEPTDEMIKAAFDTVDVRDRSWHETIKIALRAGIAAAKGEA